MNDADGSNGRAAESQSASRRQALARGRPVVFLVTILLSIGTFLFLDDRAPTLVVHTEPANAPSPRPAFMPSLGVDAVPQRSVHSIGHVVSGDTAGLYGGTKSNTCDATAIADFLGANPAQADAWARALVIQPGDIAPYLATLTPLTLRTDAAVTNHGFEDGSATPFQSVLQAGTAVLVDAEGLPRVRCYCGNPLQVPAPRTDVDVRTVSFEGPRWEGFEPESVTTVDPAPTQIDTFVVLNQDNDKVVIRPRSTAGHADRSVSVEVDNSVRNNFVVNGVEVGAPGSSAALVPYGVKTSSRSDALTAAGGGQPGAGAPSDAAVATGALAPTGTAPPSVGSLASAGALTATSGPLEGSGGGPTSGGSQDAVVTTSSPRGGTTKTPTPTSKATTSKATKSKTSAGKTSTSKTTSKATKSKTSASKTTSKTSASKTTSKTTTKKAAAEETESE